MSGEALKNDPMKASELSPSLQHLDRIDERLATITDELKRDAENTLSGEDMAPQRTLEALALAESVAAIRRENQSARDSLEAAADLDVQIISR